MASNRNISWNQVVTHLLGGSIASGFGNANTSVNIGAGDGVNGTFLEFIV